METRRKYEKPAIRFVTDLRCILECLYEVYGSEGELLTKGVQLSDTVIYPFIRMIGGKCKALDAENLNQMLWKIYMANPRREGFVKQAEKELQVYLEEKDD